jgi:ribosome-associated heat shock protein Hsp15
MLDTLHAVEGAKVSMFQDFKEQRFKSQCFNVFRTFSCLYRKVLSFRAGIGSAGAAATAGGMASYEGFMTGLRMDAWLWAARFFKTRKLAKKACDLGRILSNGQIAKAAREVRVSDMLRITNSGGDFEVEVLGLSDVRGPAAEAQKMYRETEASREARAKATAERKALREFEILPQGRPSKRERKRIIQFRGRG